jgi:cation diffusion facilitator CzcD-associated flavoprotein CzcO
VTDAARRPETAEANPRIVIMGAGFSGIGAAIRLLKSGEDDFVILERAEELGGTWRDNVYPGCRCDVPSHLYSYSFALNPGWHRTYADRDEIWAYLRATAERFGVPAHIRWSHRVLDATWDDAQGWTVTTDRGVLHCQYLVSATGSLAEPSTPAIPGANRFAGTVMHSARWDTSHRFDGQRVAVIGTGASSVQIVPSIQPTVGHLSVFQRTPGWVLAHPVRPIRRFERILFGLFPPVQRLVRAITYWQREIVLVSAFTKYDGLRMVLERQVRRHLNAQVQDPELRAKLTPNYQLGCKRALPSSDFYPALTRPNVDLVTEPIARIEPEGILTTDGELHRLDVIIFATGFLVSDNPIAEHIVGREGHRLSEAFTGDLACYLGTTFPHFPNFFMLTGPNTGTGHTSQIFMIESQLNYLLDALDALGDGTDVVAEVLPSVAEAFTDELQAKVKKTVWASGCSSWYLNAHGRNVTMWPDYTFSYRRQTRRFDPSDYVIGHRHDEPARRSVRGVEVE